MGNGILVKLCSPGDAPGVAVARAFLLRPFDWAETCGVDIKTDSTTDNNQASQLQRQERPLRNGSMNSL